MDGHRPGGIVQWKWPFPPIYMLNHSHCMSKKYQNLHNTKTYPIYNSNLQNRDVDVVQDVCQRLGYTVHELNKEEEANLERLWGLLHEALCQNLHNTKTTLIYNSNLQDRDADVVQDVCQRLGYTVHELNEEEEANFERYEDFFKKLYAKVMSYRILQNHTAHVVSYWNACDNSKWLLACT